MNKKGTQWEEGEKEKCEQKGDPVGRRREEEGRKRSETSVKKRRLLKKTGVEKLTIKETVEKQKNNNKQDVEEEEAEEEEEETTTYLLRAGQKVSWSLDVDSKGSLPSPENTNKPHFRRPSTTHPLQHRKDPETVSKPKRQHWRNVCEAGLSNYGFS